MPVINQSPRPPDLVRGLVRRRLDELEISDAELSWLVGRDASYVISISGEGRQPPSTSAHRPGAAICCFRPPAAIDRLSVEATTNSATSSASAPNQIQHVPAASRRVQFLCRSVTVLGILEAA